MPYKIVSTRRRGRAELCTVPSLWETKGRLRWPKHDAETLSRDDHVEPRQDWLTFNCSLKRKNFRTYEEAEEELTNMLNKTDTDTDLDQVANSTYRVQSSTGPNFNSLAQSLIDSESVANPVVESEPPIIYNYEVVTEDRSQNIPTQENNVLQQLNTIHIIQNIMMENQDKIIRKLAEVSVQLQEYRNERDSFSVTTLAQAKGMETKTISVKPINNIDDLQQLDKQLSDPEAFEKLQQMYSFLCSAISGNGTNCAYRLLDVLFTKEFLCKCSWTGGSRKADVKIGFKAFKHIIKFFFTMCHSWDCTYTMEDNENFFKTVLRNALKRRDSKNIRTSAQKKRVKKNGNEKESNNNPNHDDGNNHNKESENNCNNDSKNDENPNNDDENNFENNNETKSKENNENDHGDQTNEQDEESLC